MGNVVGLLLVAVGLFLLGAGLNGHAKAVDTAAQYGAPAHVAAFSQNG